MKRSSGPRKTANLSKSIHRQVNMYALAASAAGVTILALEPPALAKIVYTPAHVQLQRSKPFPLDLNHDGKVDFYLNSYGEYSTVALSACQYLIRGERGIFCSSVQGSNAIRTSVDSKGWQFGAALRHGATIKNGDRFPKGGVRLGEVSTDEGSSTSWVGPWFNGGKGVKDRYLGLKFNIKGSFHFGWARMTVTTTKNTFTATLTGYAYETIAGKPIVAGQTKGTDDLPEWPDAALTGPIPDPATVGALALGAPGLSIWRREESAETAQ
jgi:hypothetical protein